jgi:hypothetical protein
MLSRDEILSKTDLKKQTVNIPEWGGEVIVSEMSGEARDQWEQSLHDKDSKGRLVNPRANLVIATVVDEKGNRLFNDQDRDAVGKISSATLEIICRVAQRINKLTVDDLEQEKKN